jgi:hypothetical protein
VSGEPGGLRPHNGLRYALSLSLLAFVAHFVWENVQCGALFVHGSFDATLGGMLFASAGDVLLTWVIYIAVAAAARRWTWPGQVWGWRIWLALEVAAIALAIAIEARALGTGRWQYVDAMPLLPWTSIGLVPILQLTLVTPLVVRLNERLVRGRRRPGAAL